MSSCEKKTCCAPTDDATRDSVKDYYGKVLSTNDDLKTNACTLNRKKMPKHVREALSMVNEDVSSKLVKFCCLSPV